MTDPNEKIDYEKENECCLCMSTLYEDLDKKSVSEIITQQKQIFAAKIKKYYMNEEQK
mgnify:CR=1 FL=1